MASVRPFTRAFDRLKAVGLRPTRQRLALARLLFEQGDRHVTAEQLHAQAETAGVRVSLATVYNTLHQFTARGMLREVAVDSGRSYFDTNTAEHHHFFNRETAELTDIPRDSVILSALPEAPEGAQIDRVDVIVQLRKK